MKTRVLLHLAAFFVAYIAGLVAFSFLCGCSGEAFSAARGETADAGEGDAAPASLGTGGAVGTGGANLARATGGSASGGAGGSTGGTRATGGAPQGKGGTVPTGGASSGGASSTGGVVGDAGDGGVVDAGGAPGTGGASGSTGGSIACTLVTHDNGLGQTWQDCVPLGTYDATQAMKACGASDAKICTVVVACGPSLPEVRGYNTATIPVNPTSPEIGGRWGYVGSLAGYVGTGTSGELCYGSSDPNNRTWR